MRFLQIRVIMHGSDLKKNHPSDPMHAWLQITSAASQPARGHWRASPVKLTAIYIRLRAHIIDQTAAARSGHCASVWLKSFDRLCVQLYTDHACTVRDQNLCQNGTFSSTSNRPALFRPSQRYSVLLKIQLQTACAHA